MILSFYYLQIVKIENLAHLIELRVLNLAGNEIVNVCNVSGIKARLSIKAAMTSSKIHLFKCIIYYSAHPRVVFGSYSLF